MIDYIKQFRKEFKNRLPLPTSHYGELQKDLESFLSQSLTRIEEVAYREGMAYKGKAVREAYEHGYREGIHEGYNQKMEELTPSEEKEFVSDTNVTSKEEEECICKECQNGEICEACEDFGHQSPKKEKRGR